METNLTPGPAACDARGVVKPLTPTQVDDGNVDDELAREATAEHIELLANLAED